MGDFEDFLRVTFFPALFGGEQFDSSFRKILGCRVNSGGLGIPETRLSAESAYKNSKGTSGELVGPILGCTTLNYLEHRVCVSRASVGARKEQN